MSWLRLAFQNCRPAKSRSAFHSHGCIPCHDSRWHPNDCVAQHMACQLREGRRGEQERVDCRAVDHSALTDKVRQLAGESKSCIPDILQLLLLLPQHRWHYPVYPSCYYCYVSDTDITMACMTTSTFFHDDVSDIHMALLPCLHLKKEHYHQCCYFYDYCNYYYYYYY